MRKMFRCCVTGLVFVCFSLIIGCTDRSGPLPTADDFSSLNSEVILSSEDGSYENLRALLGNATYADLLAVLDGCLDKLAVLQSQDDTDAADYNKLYLIFYNLRAMMQEEDAQADESTAIGEAFEGISELLGMMEQAHAGRLLNQLLEQTGTDLGIESMLVYALAADDDIIKNALNGVSFGSIDEADFYTMADIAHDLLDADGKYSTLHTDLESIVNALTGNTVADLSAQDAVDLISSFFDALADTEQSAAQEASDVTAHEILDEILAALDELWSDDEQFRADLVLLLGEAGRLLAAQTGGETDFGRILKGLEGLLSPESTRRAHLKEYVTSALHGVALLADGARLQTLIKKIAKADSDNDGIADSMNDYSEGGIGQGVLSLVTRNMYNQDRATASVTTSALRSLIFMLQEGNQDLTILGIPELGLITSPDGGTISGYTTVVDNWAVGEVATALRMARGWNTDKTTYTFMAEADIDGSGAVDVFEAFDWVLYVKTYELLDLDIAGVTQFSGLVGTLTNALVQALIPVSIADAFPAFVELQGGYAATGEGEDADAYMDRNGTAGARHKLFALFAPLLEYFWDPNGDGEYSDECVTDLVGLLVSLNEIGVDAGQNPYITYSLDYRSLYYNALGYSSATGYTRSSATFRTDASGDILKLIDGADGCDGGILAYALRSHDGSTEDGLLLDAAVDLFVRIICKLDSSEHRLSDGSTAYDGLWKKVDLDGLSDDSIETIITTLFDGDDALIDAAYNLLAGNHAALVAITRPVGSLLVNLTATNAATGTSSCVALIDDVITLWPVMKNLVSIDDTSANTLGDYVDYLLQTKADGSDNALMLTIKQLLYKILDLRHTTYNPDGALDMDTALTGPEGLLAHLIGSESEDGLYDLSPLLEFLTDATQDSDMLWTALSSLGDILGNALGSTGEPYQEAAITLEFLRALVLDVDEDGDGVKDGTVLSDLGGLIHLDGVDLEGVIADLAQLLETGNVDFGADSDLFAGLYDILDFIVENATVR